MTHRPQPNFAPTAFAVKTSGRGRPVIFIPGFACPGSVWDGTIAHLDGKVEAHVLTLAGFAGQPPISSPSLATVRDQIVRYIVHNDLVRPVIVGHSLGGTMALWLAETFPDLGGIIDIEGTAFLPALNNPAITHENAVAVAKTRSDQIAALTPDQLSAFVAQMMGHMFSEPEDLDRVGAEAAKSDVATLAALFAEGFAKDLRADLGKITTHVTLIAATPGAAREQLQAAWHAQVDAINGAELVFIDAKHFVMLDQTDTFYGLLDEALARCWSSPS
jgi:N-formylmaleamate deformylase